MTATLPEKTRKRNRKMTRERNRRILRDRKRRILKRILNRPGPERDQPMMTATNIHYELADRVQGLSAGGIGAMLLLVQDRLDPRHRPQPPSLQTPSALSRIRPCPEHCLQHPRGRQTDRTPRTAAQRRGLSQCLGRRRIPDPTTEGDFCRRFAESDVVTLIDALNETRLRVWSQQPSAFFTEAILDVDGTLVATDAECKQGVDIAYNGTWGYHPLLISLANTAEPLYLVNRSGNRPSHEHAADSLDKMIALCRRAGFQRILVRGDTDFTQTQHLDRWDEAGDIGFVFGIDAHQTLKARADALPTEAYSFLERPPRYAIQTAPRQQPERIKPQIVQERGYQTIHLLEEMIAEFDYRPVACRKSYRVVVQRKRLGTDQGQLRLFEEYRYFFHITNDRTTPADRIVFSANDRCDQENLIAQLKSGVHALTTPVNDLVSNWAYMVMASLAWSLKAWSALMVPVSPRHAAKHAAEKRSWLRMEFATFCAAVIQMPCQLVRSGGRLIYRLLSWTPWQGVFLRLVERLHGCWLC